MVEEDGELCAVNLRKTAATRGEERQEPTMNQRQALGGRKEVASQTCSWLWLSGLGAQDHDLRGQEDVRANIGRSRGCSMSVKSGHMRRHAKKSWPLLQGNKNLHLPGHLEFVARGPLNVSLLRSCMPLWVTLVSA